MVTMAGHDNTYTLRTRTRRRCSSRRATATSADDLYSDDDIASNDKGASAKRFRANIVYKNDDEDVYISFTQSSDEYDNDNGDEEDDNDDDDENIFYVLMNKIKDESEIIMVRCFQETVVDGWDAFRYPCCGKIEYDSIRF